MGYVKRLESGFFDVFGFGQGEGLYNCTREELEQLRKDIECELMQDEYDLNGNPIRIGG